jgi:UDP-glucose 4-epimerase
MNILITGGLGFIGSNLARKCVDLGYNVHILSRSKEKIKNIKGIEDKVKLTIKDIKDIGEEVKDKDWIFHFASTVDNYNLWEDPYKDIEINCNGTISLLEACRKDNPSARILYSSTFFVNGNLENLPANKHSSVSPQGLYPATRLAGEYFCKIYNQVFGLNSTIARFTNVFGEGEQRDNKKKAAFNKLISMAIDNEEIPLYSNGNFIRDYIYVSDVVDGCINIMEKGKMGEIYYVGRGEGVRFRDLMEMVVEEAKGGKLVPINPPEFHKNVGIKDYYCDNSDLRKLGWRPKVSLREGIKKTIESYKNG